VTTPASAKKLRIRRIRITGWSALTALMVTLVSFLAWFHLVLPADRGATLEVFRDDRVVFSTHNDTLVLAPATTQSTRGLLYFPGAKVDPYSYLHPFLEVAAGGVTVVIVEPTLNMALFDTRDFATLTGSHPAIKDWAIAGHSLGGVRACMLADDPQVRTLVLFASFCAEDLSMANLDVIQVLGDADGLIDEATRLEAQSLLPAGRYSTIVIPGANHASFGTYGPQPGDGESSLTDAQMQEVMTEVMTTWVWSD